MKNVLERKRIEKLFKNGKREIFDGFILIYSKNKNGEYAVVVSKKIARGAVKRNKIKRISREIIRNSYPLPFDVIVFFTKKNILLVEIKNNLKNALQALKINVIIK